MFRRNKKQLNLLDMSPRERRQLLRNVKKNLKNKALEHKLHRMLIEAENITMNGKVVYEEGQQLTGLTIETIQQASNYSFFR